MRKNLSEVENAILRNLHRGMVLNQESLASIPELADKLPISYTHFQVLITHIRQQLTDGWSIVAVGKGSTKENELPSYKLVPPPADD